MISLAEENTRLKQALDHEVENCRLAHESCLGHVRQIQSLQSQLAEAQNKVEAIVNEDNAITAETSKQLAQLHKDYELLEQERDKLQGVVQAAKVLFEKLEFVHASDNYKSAWMISQLHAGPYLGPNYGSEMNGLKEVLDRTPKDLPKFVTEEEYLRVKGELETLKDWNLATQNSPDALKEIMKSYDLLKSHAEAMANKLETHGFSMVKKYRKDFPKGELSKEIN